MTTPIDYDGTIVRCYLSGPWSTTEEFVIWRTYSDGRLLMQQMRPELPEKPHQDLLPSGLLVRGRVVDGKMALPGGIVLTGFIPSGEYVPRDPAYNSLEIMVDQALTRTPLELASPPESLEDIAATHRQLVEVETRAHDIRQSMYEQIRQAYASGLGSMPQIGQAAGGMSRQSVSEILGRSR